MLLRTLAWTGVLGLGTLTLSACQSSGSTGADDGPAVTSTEVAPSQGAPVNLRRVTPMTLISTASAEMGGPKAYTLELIHSAADLPAVVKDQGLEVDFALHSVVLLGMGQQPTSGYSAEITAVQQVGNEVFVQARFTKPDGQMVAQVVTAPWAAATIFKRVPGTNVRSDFE